MDRGTENTTLSGSSVSLVQGSSVTTIMGTSVEEGSLVPWDGTGSLLPMTRGSSSKELISTFWSAGSDPLLEV